MMIFGNRKGIISAHPVYLFIIGLIAGIILTILWANGTIAIKFPFCK